MPARGAIAPAELRGGRCQSLEFLESFINGGWLQGIGSESAIGVQGNSFRGNPLDSRRCEGDNLLDCLQRLTASANSMPAPRPKSNCGTPRACRSLKTIQNPCASSGRGNESPVRLETQTVQTAAEFTRLIRQLVSPTDITRYRSAGGAICRLIRVIRWFGDKPSTWTRYDTKWPMVRRKACSVFWDGISRQRRNGHHCCECRYLVGILRLTTETPQTVISGPSARVSKPARF